MTQLKNPKNFRTVLAVGEQMFSLYKHEQAGEPMAEVPELCERYDIGKTKLYEVLLGGKYKKEMSTPKSESAKPARRVATIKLGEMEETPRKGAWQKVIVKHFVKQIQVLTGPPIPPKENIN